MWEPSVHLFNLQIWLPINSEQDTKKVCSSQEEEKCVQVRVRRRLPLPIGSRWIFPSYENMRFICKNVKSSCDDIEQQKNQSGNLIAYFCALLNVYGSV